MAIILRFHLFQAITQHYKQRTVLTKSVSAINPITMENTHKIPTQLLGSLIVLSYHVVSEKNWNTKEDNSRSMMCVLYILQLVKGHILGHSDVE